MMKLIFAATMAASMPIIWGDGIHDDTDGMEALVCGETFGFPDRQVIFTYDANGKQTVGFDKDTVLLLPHGMPVPLGGQRKVKHRDDQTTYPIDCASRKVS